MAHFAKLDENNIVVLVVHGRQEDDGKEVEISARTGDTYKQTSYNTKGGKHLKGGTPFEKITLVRDIPMMQVEMRSYHLNHMQVGHSMKQVVCGSHLLHIHLIWIKQNYIVGTKQIENG